MGHSAPADRSTCHSPSPPLSPCHLLLHWGMHLLLSWPFSVAQSQLSRLLVVSILCTFLWALGGAPLGHWWGGHWPLTPLRPPQGYPLLPSCSTSSAPLASPWTYFLIFSVFPPILLVNQDCAADSLLLLLLIPWVSSLAFSGGPPLRSMTSFLYVGLWLVHCEPQPGYHRVSCISNPL